MNDSNKLNVNVSAMKIDWFNEYINTLISVKIPAMFTFGSSLVMGIFTNAFSVDNVIHAWLPIIGLLVPIIIGAFWTWKRAKSKHKAEVLSHYKALEQKEELHFLEAMQNLIEIGIITEEMPHEKKIEVTKNYLEHIKKTNL